MLKCASLLLSSLFSIPSFYIIKKSLWQVQVQGALLVPIKPKMFLTCTMILSRGEWVKIG